MSGGGASGGGGGGVSGGGDERADLKTGLAFGFAAYGYWALVFPLHLKLLNWASPDAIVASQPWWALEVLANRVVWSLGLCFALLWWLGRFGDLKRVLVSRRDLMPLFVTAVLISFNWGIFIYAVATEQLYRAGIGYFVTPMVHIALGMIFLGERLRRAQWAAVVSAGCGIVWLMVVSGAFPWIELVLAGSFGFYGLIRKRAKAGPIVGLTVETGFLIPAAVGLLVWISVSRVSELALVEGGVGSVGLLVLTGVSTGLPLLWFAAAAKKLPLSTIGFLQFLAPTGQFLLGVLAFGERPPDERMWFGYGLVWLGVLFIVVNSVHRERLRRRVSAEPV